MMCFRCNEKEAALLDVLCPDCLAWHEARVAQYEANDHRIRSGALDRSAHARLDRVLQQRKGA